MASATVWLTERRRRHGAARPRAALSHHRTGHALTSATVVRMTRVADGGRPKLRGRLTRLSQFQSGKPQRDTPLQTLVATDPSDLEHQCETQIESRWPREPAAGTRSDIDHLAAGTQRTDPAAHRLHPRRSLSMRYSPRSGGLFFELALPAFGLAVLFIASMAGGLTAPALWTLATIVGAGYMLGRRRSRTAARACPVRSSGWR